MSKTVKNLMIRDYKSRLEGINDALVVSIRGMGAIDNNRMRLELQKQKVRVMVVRNNLANQAFKGTTLAALEPLMNGPTALAFGAESVVDVARAVMDWAKKLEKLELKGAVLDGILFEGRKGVEELSKFPTKVEAQAQAITLILSPARNLMGQIKGPAGKVMGIVKSVEEKLEKGEAIAKIA